MATTLAQTMSLACTAATSIMNVIDSQAVRLSTGMCLKRVYQY